MILLRGWPCSRILELILIYIYIFLHDEDNDNKGSRYRGDGCGNGLVISFVDFCVWAFFVEVF